MATKDKDRIKQYKGWQASGQSLQTYCDGQGIKFHGFKNAIYRLRKQGKLPTRGQKGGVGFQRVAIIEDAMVSEKAAYCEIRFSNLDTIKISSKESLVALKGMLECLLRG